MASDKIIEAAADPAFCQRVAYIALRVANEIAGESPDTEGSLERMTYAEQIFRGEDKALLLTLHVVAAEGKISDALQNGGAAEVQDLDIENALKAIWDTRAAAYAATNHNLQLIKKIMVDAQNVATEATNASRIVTASLARMEELNNSDTK